MAGAPRREPFPYDALVTDPRTGQKVGVMLAQAKKGAKLVATKNGTLDQVAPISFEYGSQSPVAERIQPFEDFSLGYGQGRQSAWIDRKYSYGRHVDATVSGQVIKGPKITTLTPATTDTTSGVVALFDIDGVTFSCNGRYVHRRVSDTNWVLEKDFDFGGGGSGVATDVCVFATNATEPGVTYAYFALGTSDKIYRFDGTTWQQHASMFADHFGLIGRDIYRSTDVNMVAKCSTDADPWIEANWTSANQFRIGDKSSAIQKLAATSLQQLLVFKTDGIYSLDGSTGQDVPLFDSLKFQPNPDNGKYVGSFLDSIHVGYGGVHYRLDPVSQLGTIHYELNNIGPERLVENTSPVRGEVTAFQSVEGLYAVAGIFDRDTGNAYLLKFSGWVSPTTSDGKLDEAQRVDAWHGAISGEFTSKITAMWCSPNGASPAHTRTYFGFADGSVGWFQNSCVPNPTLCTDYEFCPENAEFYLPKWNGLFKADAKLLRAHTVAGPNLSPNLYAQIEYRVNSAAPWTVLGQTHSPPLTTLSYDGQTWGVELEFRMLLVSLPGTSGTPIVTAQALHHSVKPALVLLYEFFVEAANGLVKRDNSLIRMDASDIRDLIQAVASNPASTTFVLPDESSQPLSQIDYGEAMGWDERLQGWQATLHCKAVQMQLNTDTGIVSRLKPYRVQDLSTFTCQQLGTL